MREFTIYQGMRGGQHEQSIRKYKKIVGKSGIWYIAIQEDEGDNIYFTKGNGVFSQGFAGSNLSFILEDGTEEYVQGPWHSNSGALLADTGYDTSHKHLTRGIIALDSEPVLESYNKTQHKEVLHYDEEPVIGDHSRIEIMAQEFANKLNKSVYAAKVSTGGGSAGWIKPLIN
jgi:hypothetical protein